MRPVPKFVAPDLVFPSGLVGTRIGKTAVLAVKGFR